MYSLNFLHDTVSFLLYSHAVPHQLKQQQQLQQQHQPATIVADDGFGDFLSSPTGNTALGPCIQTLQSNSTPSSSSSVQSDQGSFGKNDSSVAGITSVPITIATQVPVNTDKKGNNNSNNQFNMF